jgi:hypothetical protein
MRYAGGGYGVAATLLLEVSVAEAGTINLSTMTDPAKLAQLDGAITARAHGALGGDCEHSRFPCG